MNSEQIKRLEDLTLYSVKDKDDPLLAKIRVKSDRKGFYDGFKEDVKNEKIVSFLIKDSQDRVYAFLSLRMGELFYPIPDKELKAGFLLSKLEENMNGYSHDTYFNHVGFTTSSFKNSIQFVDSQTRAPIVVKYQHPLAQQPQYGITPTDQQQSYSFIQTENALTDHIAVQYSQVSDDAIELSVQWEDIAEDDELEGGSVHYVHEAFSAVEIVKYGVNDNMRELVKDEFPGHRLGELIYWNNVVKLLCDYKEQLGVTHVYSFAADTNLTTLKGKSVEKVLRTEPGRLKLVETLIKYYKRYPSFMHENPLHVNKSEDNRRCLFLYQDISMLEIERQKWFEKCT